MAKLNAKQRLFVSHYVVDRNATKAAKAAGYPPKSAHDHGCRLLKKVDVSQAIERELSKLTENNVLTAQMVLDEIRKLAFVDNMAVFNEDGSMKPIEEWPEANRKAVVGHESEHLFVGRGSQRRKIGAIKKVKNADKTRSLEMLAKHFKLLTEMHELSGKGGEPLVVLTMPANGSEKTKEDKPA